MTPIFKCLICRKDIERSTKTFWVKKGHLLCSTCLDNIDKKSKSINQKIWNHIHFVPILQKKTLYKTRLQVEIKSFKGFRNNLTKSNVDNLGIRVFILKLKGIKF